jgi:hypothetical protein
MLIGGFSKWFMDSLGHDGLNKLLVGFEDKSAEAICTFAYSEGPGHEPIIFQGRTDVSYFVWFKIHRSKYRTNKCHFRVRSFQQEVRLVLVSISFDEDILPLSKQI